MSASILVVDVVTLITSVSVCCHSAQYTPPCWGKNAYLFPMGHLDLLVERVVTDGSHTPTSPEKLQRHKLIMMDSNGHPAVV